MKLNLIGRQVINLIAVSTAVRLLLALLLELGNDEVYYWTYACYPDLSYFDHPPMVGLLIRASTLNLLFADDFFLRLGPIMLAAADTWIMYRIGTKVKDENTGLLAALLFTSSIYCSIIAGFSIIPDAPEVFFWLLSLHAALDFLPAAKIDKSKRLKFILFGVYAGLAMLSKYHAAFLWMGALLYIVFFNRRWLKDYSLYVAALISLLLITPIIYWNIIHDFITISFHGDRVTPSLQIHLDYFLREIAGQIAYNNPLNYGLIVIACIGLMQKKIVLDAHIRILLLTSLPLLVLFTGFSLFRSTLPHWTGPSFIGLTIIAAMYWSPYLRGIGDRSIVTSRFMLPVFFLLLMICAAVVVIDFSPFSFGKQTEATHLGDGDFTQDLYGWESIGQDFVKIAERQEQAGKVQHGASLISFRWFPGAHEDFYVARQMRRKLYVIGPLQDTHQYCWINNKRGGLVAGNDYYHIAVSNYYRDPYVLFKNMFDEIEPIDTIDVTRTGTVVRKAFVYRLKHYKGS